MAKVGDVTGPLRTPCIYRAHPIFPLEKSTQIMPSSAPSFIDRLAALRMLSQA